MRLLRLAGVRPAFRHLLEAPRQEAPEGLRGPTRRVEEVDEDMPHVGLQPGLLHEFPPGTGQRRFLVGVEQARRRFEEITAHRVPVLPDEQQPVVLIEGNDPHRPRVHHEVSGNAVVADQHVVGAHVPDGPGELRAPPDDLMGVEVVLDGSVPDLIHSDGPTPHAPGR